MLPEWISIGELAERTGVATSALRFYEQRGLISAQRNQGNQRRFARATIRRVSVVRAAQRCGVSLDEIAAALASLPAERDARQADWRRMSKAWRDRLDQRITALQALRDDLSGCIGCGCLSMQRCKLLNPDDEAGLQGPGARFLPPGPEPAER